MVYKMESILLGFFFVDDDDVTRLFGNQGNVAYDIMDTDTAPSAVP